MRREARLQRAEHDALFDEAVVAAVIFESQFAVLEGSVRAFEAAGEGRDSPGSEFGSDKPGRDQRRSIANAIRSGDIRIAHLRGARSDQPTLGWSVPSA